MRIAISVILLIDLFIRSLSIIAFFTDEGILPIETLKQYNWGFGYFSLHSINGDLWLQIILFLINSICISLLLIGYRARLFTFICWVFLTSMQNRNPFILQGGDDLLRVLLFWGVFLPWGERYSVKKTSTLPNTYFGWENIAYLLLPCSVLFFSALLKTSPEWHTEGTALYYALSLDQIRLPFGTFLYNFPTLLTVLTFIVYYIELLAPILVIIPFVPTYIRMIGIALITILFLGISVSLYVGLFYLIGISSFIGALPSSILDWFEKKWFQNKTIYCKTENLKPHWLLESFLSIKNAFIIFIACFCLAMNLGSVKKFPYALTPEIVTYGKVFRLEQNWGMFSPYILKEDGWFIYSGRAKNNTYIDIKHNGKLVSFIKPNPAVCEFESDRWRKFQENYTFKNNNYMRPFYCKYLLKKWNKENPNNPISDLAIFFMKETSLPNYATKPIEKSTVCYCEVEK
jgi:hypothetical protein